MLNFGNYPSQPVQRGDEYDETQLAGDAARKYGQASRSSSTIDNHRTTADIYGAESQWSTKLTRTSFQPSFLVNQVTSSKGSETWPHDPTSKNADLPEIITAPPEVSSVTLVVSSDDKRTKKKEEEEEDESTLMGTTIFGMKTQEHTERNTATTDSAINEKRNGSEVDGKESSRPMGDEVESSTKQLMTDLEKIGRKGDNSTGVKKVII